MEDAATTEMSTAVPRTGTVFPSKRASVPSPSDANDHRNAKAIDGEHGAQRTQTTSSSAGTSTGSLEAHSQEEESSSDDEIEEPQDVPEKKWEVARVLASAILSDGLLYYRVAWKGWGRPDYSMYPAHNFRGSPDRLISFHRRNPKEAGPPMRLRIWKEAFDNGQELTKHEDDDFPEKNGSK